MSQPAERRLVTEAALADALAGFSVGGVPIFDTLAEAEAWEAANPGKRALTLTPSTPDTEPPFPGTLTVTTDSDYADLTVTGAWDNRRVAGYAYSADRGQTWSEWHPEPTYRLEGLSRSTTYEFQHRVRDIGENVSVGGYVTKATLAGPFLAAADDFDTASGSIVGRVTPVGGLVWGQGVASDYLANASVAAVPTAANGRISSGAAILTLPKVAKTVSIDVTGTAGMVRVAIASEQNTATVLMVQIDFDRSALNFYNGSTLISIGPTQVPFGPGRYVFTYDGTHLSATKDGETIRGQTPVSGKTGLRAGFVIQGPGDCTVDNFEVRPQ